MPELVAALRLAQLDGASAERRAAVQAVYDTFTEGFDTPALQEARAWVTGPLHRQHIRGLDATDRLLYLGSNERLLYTKEAVMGFPDRIERTVEIAHPPARVWAALTTAEGLGTWFGDAATIDLRPGGAAEMTWASGEKASMRIERVEAPTVFGFTWGINGLPDDDPRRTYVEFTLEPMAAAPG